MFRVIGSFRGEGDVLLLLKVEMRQGEGELLAEERGQVSGNG